MPIPQSQLQNILIQQHDFLQEMYEDDYFPNELVDQGKTLLIELCSTIEAQQPKNLDDLYRLTHAITEAFNELSVVFEEQDSEIETVARDCISMDILFIAQAYGFTDADAEDLIAPREW